MKNQTLTELKPKFNIFKKQKRIKNPKIIDI